MNQTVQLTLAQQAALSHDRHVIVTAGAGTGKTEVLIRRYLALLREPDVQHISQILALTFTEKAAGEMKHRVYRALLRAARDPDTSAAGRVKFQTFQDQFLLNHISTIDAFFSSVIRRFPYHIPGFDPEFSVLEGYRQRQLLERTVEETLDAAATDTSHVCHSSLRELLLGRSKRELLALVSQMVSRRHFLVPWMEWLASSLDTAVLDRWRELVEGERDSALAAAHTQTAELVEELRSFQPRGTGQDAALKTQQAILDGFTDDPDALLTALFTSVGKPRSFSHGSQRVWGDQKTPLNECFARIAACIQPFYTMLQMGWDEDLELEALEDLRALCQIGQFVIQEYQQRKLNLGVVDFPDLQIYAEQALNEPSVLQTYQRQFRYIMVDEFQDTNLAQWQQIRRLAEDPDHPGRVLPDKLFVVGDEKQAIYRFRGGEVEVCHEAQQFIPTENRKNQRTIPYPTVEDFSNALRLDGQLGFDVNFRSRPNLLHFFNTFFEPLLVKEAAYEAQAQTLYYRDGSLPDPIPSSPEHGNVEVLRINAETEDEDQIGLDVLEARCIAARLRAILDGQHDALYPGLREQLERRERAVGYLFRRRTKQKIYEQALREYGVPYVVARGRGFFSRQEVLDVSHALNVLVHPYQDISLVGLFRSPYVAASDNALVHLGRSEGRYFLEKLGTLSLDLLTPEDRRAVVKLRGLLTDWQALMPSLLPSELVLHILHTSGILAPLSRGSDGPQRVSNVYKLVDLARQFEQEAPNSLVEFVEFLQRQIAEEEDEGEADLPEGGGVQIMTVHQSKGLEFPLVILPDTVFPFRSDSGILFGRLDGEAQVGWICARDDADGEKTAIHSLLCTQNDQAMVAEEKRLLYVAMTRARDHLWLTLREPRPDKTPDGLADARTWRDWLWLGLQETSLNWIPGLPVEAPFPPDLIGDGGPVDFDPDLV